MHKTYQRTLFILLCLSHLFYSAKAHLCSDSIRISAITNVSCIGKSDGSAAVLVVVGSGPPYKYQWNTTPIQTNASATGLSAGIYTVSVFDSTAGCTTTASVTITAPPYTITNFAGTGSSGHTGDGGPATAAGLSSPFQLAIDPAGDIIVADANHNCIRKINSSGIITNLIGNGSPGYSGDYGPASLAELHYSTGVTLDAAGNIYIADEFNNRVRMVNTSGTITTIAGNGYGAPINGGYFGDGGPATAAEFFLPSSVLTDASGNVYVADAGNQCVRKITKSTGVITTIAGNGITGAGYSGDGGQATAADLHNPLGMVFDAAGNLYIADRGNNVVRKVDPSGIITSVFGNGYNAGGPGGYTGDGGPASSAELFTPFWVMIDPAGNFYITDNGNHVIREVSNGIITTIAGNHTISNYTVTGGLAVNAGIGAPVCIVMDGSYNIYFSDSFDDYMGELHACPYCTASTSITNALACSSSTNGAAKAIPTDGESPYQYSWNNGNTQATASNLSAGTYTVTIQDSLNCKATATATLSGTSITATIIGPDSLCKGDIISLTATGGASYLWNNTSTSAIIEVNPLADTTYMVTAFNGPCKDSATHSIFVATDGSICIIKFYNGITPNGDGHNDYWQIDNIELYPDNTVQIFNRWGSDVWDATGYDNNKVVWRGDDHRGKPLPDGTYYYLVKINGRKYNGWVQLTR